MLNLTRTFFMSAILTAVLCFSLVGCSSDGDSTPQTTAQPSEEELVGDDGGLPPVNDPEVERFYKHFDFAEVLHSCDLVESSERENCRTNAVRVTQTELMKRDNRLNLDSLNPEKKEMVNDIRTHYRTSFAKCTNNKCRAIQNAATAVVLDNFLYASQEHINNYIGGVDGNLSKMCVRIKKDLDAIYVFNSDDSFTYTVTNKDGQSGQYTAVGYHEDTKKLMLVESTQKSDFLRFNGAVVGFVNPHDVEEVTTGGLCEPIANTYIRDPYN